MFKNYLNIALRSLQRNLVYTIINITGLSAGIACSILILLWVHDELTFNNYFKKHDVIHQVKLNTPTDNGVVTGSFTSWPLKEALEQDTRFKKIAITVAQAAVLSVGDKKLMALGRHASESYTEIFDFHMIEGNPKTILNDPYSIVLNASTARALFGTTNCLGKMVSVKIVNTEELKVTGVFEDLPANVSISLKFILPFSYFERTLLWVRHAKGNWINNAFETFVELQPNTDLEAINNSIKDLVKKESGETAHTEPFLHPMNRWSLYNNFENGKEAGGLIDYVILFAWVAVFILVMACINFMNLSTARSQHRAREVGIRKSVGSSRKQLIFQFLGESMLIAMISFFISVVIVEIALPSYNTLVGKKLFIDYTSSMFWSFGLALMLLTGITAGSYPAFYLSSFKPVKILKGNVNVGKRAAVPRQVLVTMQFGFSIILIIGTAVVYQQIQHLRSREAGYDRENLVMVWSNTDIEKNYHALKEELLSTNAASSVTISNSPITNIFSSSPIDSWPGMLAGQHVEVTNVATEYDYTKTMGIRLLEGRDFSPEFKSDTAAMILNKAAALAMNLEHPVGEKIKMWNQFFTVIGVMDDVLMGAGANPIGPLVMTMDPTWSSTVTFRLPKTGDLSGALKRAEDIYKKYSPDFPFEYRFADDEFQQKFASIEMISKLAGSFAILAMIITALGLFGMAAFTAEQRTKEIGIRKVLGASVSGIVLMMTKDFSRLVIIAFVIAAPLAWWACADFLQHYPVRIAMPWWVFPMAGVVSLVITIIIVSTQAVKAALHNPVDSLKSE
jgi:ABC-type antimicrobial peptide transport system permease subunit